MSRVERFYDEHVEHEWGRLERHRTEFAVTMCALEDYLPPPPAAILDVGGGPGRYSVALARRGYAVTLLDISGSVLAFAEQKAHELGVELGGLVHGSATDLCPEQDESFDAVLLMGPLYHLIQPDDRERALREARRVLKPNGLVFASFITRYAPILEAARRQPEWILLHRDRCEQLLATGVLTERPGGGFTDAYFATPAEVCPLLEANGFETLDLLSAEGVTATVADEIEKLDGEAWEAWVRLNYRLGKDPSVLGAAFHLLYVGRRG